MTVGFVTYEPVIRGHSVRKERGTDGQEYYVAWYPGAEGCRAQADSEPAAVESLRDLYPRYEAAMKAIGAHAPPSRTELSGAGLVTASLSATPDSWLAGFALTQGTG